MPQGWSGFLFAQFLLHGVKLTNLAHKPCRQFVLGHPQARPEFGGRGEDFDELLDAGDEVEFNDFYSVSDA
jgi:hypothetical protein